MLGSFVLSSGYYDAYYLKALRTKALIKQAFDKAFAKYDVILGPAAPYELQGDVPNVVFPCAALQDGKRVAVYYGAADTVVCMAFGYIDEIIDYVKRTSIV